MTWKPTDHVDEQVRGWMRAKRSEVTATDYKSEQEIYSWRHQQPGGKSPTLHITEAVVEHNPAFVICITSTDSTWPALYGPIQKLDS